MKLSDRIRPGVECAPWVYDEVCCLEAERDRLAAALIRLRDCDWTISLPDRMDAVRQIAREALEESNDGTA